MSEDGQKFCDLGEDHLRRLQPEEALHWYERAVEVDPENPDAWSGRGQACYQLGQLERADKYFRRALRFMEPRVRSRPPRRGWWSDDAARGYLRILHWRALCRFWMGLHDEAARLFRRILKLAPADPLEVRFLLGETYFRMGDVDSAIREFEEAGDDPDAITNLGLAYFFKGDFLRSVNAFRRGAFENVHLTRRLANLKPLEDVPSSRATHPRELDHEDSALEYMDRCGDLWVGRPVLRKWVRQIYLHPLVQEDLARHFDHVRALQAEALAPGKAAALEGANAALRSPDRLTQTDRDVTTDVMRRVFRPPA